MKLGYFVVNDGTDRTSWLADRGRGVSATDVARLMTGGAGTWAALRAEKAGGDSFRGNQYTRHGRDREAAIAAFAEAEFGLTPSTALVGRWAEGDFDLPYNLDLATPDALGVPYAVEGSWAAVSEFGEFKTTKHDWPTWADVPARYHWQVAWQFHVTGASRCRFVFEPHEDFVPLYPEPRVFTIDRLDMHDAIAEAVEAVAAWRTAPVEPIPDDLVPLDGILQRRIAAKEDADAAAAALAAIDDEVRALLEATGRPVKFEGTGANVTWSGKPGTSSRFDQAAFKARYPATAARFTKTTETRPRLTITARS